MKYFVAIISLVITLQANGLGLIDDVMKSGKFVIYHADNPSVFLKAERISQVTYATLKLNKADQNIPALLELACKEHRLQYYSDLYTYIPLYKKFKNGDKLLWGCLKDATCNLAKYTEYIQHTYLLDKGRSTIYTVKGFINDMKVHSFVNGSGKVFDAKISEVVDLKRVIKMPYVGSIYKNANAAGYERDAIKFWKQYSTKYPEALSKNNVSFIKSGKSPIVDMQWLKYNTKHKSFFGETLEHHHLNNTDITVGIPKSLHRGQKNKELMHVD